MGVEIMMSVLPLLAILMSSSDCVVRDKFLVLHTSKFMFQKPFPDFEI